MGEGAGRPGGIGLELALKLGVDVFTLGLTNKLMPASYMVSQPPICWLPSAVS